MAKKTVLKNGVILVTEKIEAVRSAAIGVWVKSGSVYENDDNNGVSHFIEHMMFKGTETRTARQIAEDFDKIGASSNAFTGKEATCYYAKTLSSNIYKGAEMILDMILNSRFDTEEMDKERQVILEELKMVKDTPDDDVFETISQIVNKANPLGRTILGTPESLHNVDRNALTDYYRKRYARDGIVVAVAGNFDEDKLIDLFEEKMSPLNKELPEWEFVNKEYEKSFVTKVKDIEQSHLCLGIPSISSGDKDYYAYVLMNNILGGTMSSRLFQNIREQKGLAYSVYSTNVFNTKSGFFNIYAGVAHDKLKETVNAIKEELEMLAADGVTEEELEMAKEQVKSTYIFSLENTNSLMFSLGRNMILLDKLFDVDDYIHNYNAVTRNDILRCAGRIGDITKYCGAAVTGVNVNIEDLI